MSVDVKCYELAQVWLKSTGHDHTTTIATLAQRIQETIEDYVAELDDEDRHDD